MKGLLVLSCLVLTSLTFAEGVPAGCTLTGQTCVQPGGTRVINGVSVYSSCWAYAKRYTCGESTQDTCTAYEGRCQPSGVGRCLVSLAGQCLTNELTYECPTKHCTNHALYCGKDVFCLDGHCTTQTPKHNPHFGQDAAELAAAAKAAGAASKSLNDKTTVSLFGGHAQSCSIDAAGYSNCCKDKGWGKGMSLAQCSDQEKQLGKDKEHYLVTYVGQYCHNKVAGVCTSVHKVYCVYDSKLARIVSDYGRAQLGKGYGDPKHANCTGFTLEQLQHLQFNRMNFIDPVYIYPQGSANNAAGIAGDLHVHSPSAAAMEKAIHDRIQQDLAGSVPVSSTHHVSALPRLAQALRQAVRGNG